MTGLDTSTVPSVSTVTLTTATAPSWVAAGQRADVGRFEIMLPSPNITHVPLTSSIGCSDVRVVADDEVDVAGRRDLVGDLALEGGRRRPTLRPPVHADDDDLGAAEACCSCVGDDPRRLDQR